MENARRNKNRGYQQLRVWNDAVQYYVETCQIFGNFPFERKKIASQQMSCVDSIHRNIAEGYCRRSIHEYLNFLNVAMGSLGESVSGLITYNRAQQISSEDFHKLDEQAFKIENELSRLIE